MGSERKALNSRNPGYEILARDLATGRVLVVVRGEVVQPFPISKHVDRSLDEQGGSMREVTEGRVKALGPAACVARSWGGDGLLGMDVGGLSKMR
jgi:hypothetical protein